MPVTFPAGKIYLVHRSDYASHAEEGKITEIYGCYTTLVEATKRARAEVRALERECTPMRKMNVEYDPLFGAMVWVHDGGYADIEKSLISVQKMDIERYSEGEASDDEDFDDGDDEEPDSEGLGLQLESDEESEEEEEPEPESIIGIDPRPPLAPFSAHRQRQQDHEPTQTNNEPARVRTLYTPEAYPPPPPARVPARQIQRLAGRVFATAGTQRPLNRAAINSLIRTHGGTVVPLLPIRDQIQFVVLGDDVSVQMLNEMGEKGIAAMRQDQLLEILGVGG
ncbi:uncharacterized protein LY89DRAFT_734629 [Mollisia scopiformis]|uniref:BRCT domain-containing protein n=1 Tax=Mollisia scopiformis TaxID=149040 RepID=A0A194X8T6_MOLSC|nr:uncharacterized protein LY89DRAFT_734629 [Mollisia scopiformis]KUJ16529.1 hypothetical protein LY89DRAFT_734629 [Mollisia scopiformis]